MLSKRDSLYYKGTDKLKGNMWQMVYNTKNNAKESWSAYINI